MDFLLDPGVTFLNHGSYGACPRPVFARYQELQRELERNPVEFLARRFNELTAGSRAALAAFVGARPDDLVFVPNATAGLNAAIRSLRLEPGDEVLTTRHEYGAVTRTWEFMGAKLVYVLGVRFAGTILGNIFMWSNTAFYPAYAPGQAEFGIDPIADQSTAGVLMTVEGGLVTLGVLAWLFLKWAQQDTERQALIELAEERGVPLSEGRAERAVAASASATTARLGLAETGSRTSSMTHMGALSPLRGAIFVMRV